MLWFGNEWMATEGDELVGGPKLHVLVIIMCIS
jgi:hypothetical protein